MKTIRIFYLLAVTAVSCSTMGSNPPVDPPKIPSGQPQDHLIMATLWYQRSAEMRALSYQAFNWARTVVDQRLLQPSHGKKAVILDIDETILDNTPFQAELILQEQPYNPDLWYQWTRHASADALPGALKFCQYLYEKKIEVYYVSNRTVKEMKSTINNLSTLGFPYADQDHLLLKDSTSSKETRREKVADNHDIILLIGDNLNDFSALFEDRSDHDGHILVDRYADDFGSRFIILPNPMYGAWETALNQQEQSLTTVDKITRLKQKLQGYHNPE